MSSIKEYARKLRAENKDLRMKDVEGLMGSLMKDMIQEMVQEEKLLKRTLVNYHWKSLVIENQALSQCL